MDTLIGTPASPADLVAIQPDAVVSRVLLKNPGGNLTLFAFDEGEGLSEHTTPHDAVVLILEGEARITVAGREHTVATGELLHLPASVPHALHAVRPFKMLLVMLRAAGPA